MNTKRPFSRLMALVLSVALMISGTPLTAFAEAAGCNHTQHDETCGYAEGADCGHKHDESCGEGGAECTHIEHDEDCGYIEAAPCRHQHDETCGGLVDSNKTLGKSETPTGAVIVAAFDDLDDNISGQSYDLGTVTSTDDLTLPDTLTGRSEDGGKITIEGVTWGCEAGFDPAVAGGYIFSAVLPEGYALAEGLSAPFIFVSIQPEGEPELNPTAQGDTFTSNGIMYSVLTESGTTGTVSVIANSYTETSYNIPETVSDGGVTYTVTEIGVQAFRNCASLTSITLPDSLTAINNRAFDGCTGLTGSLTIPSGVTTIGTMAFYDCTGFNGTLTIPASVTTIGMMAFNNCTNLTGITSGITDFTNIDTTAFDTIKNKTVTCDPALAQIHQSYGFTNVVGAAGTTFTIGALTYTVLTAPADSTPGTVSVKATDISAISGSLTLTGSVENDSKTYTVTTISDAAFSGCTALTSLTLNTGLVTIGASAFSGCTGLTGNLTIPSCVTTIGNSAFNGCAGFTGSLTIPASVTTIGSSAFYDCTGFNGTLTIPASVTTIGELAFYNCTNLTGITSGIIDFTSVDSAAFDTIKNKPVTCDPVYVQAHQNYGFTNVVGTVGATFTIGALTYTVLTAPVDSTPGTVSVKATDRSTISGSLTLVGSVTDSSKTYTVTTIEASAFYGCTGLTGNLTIPSSVTTIGAGAFYGCTGLTGSLTLPAGVTTIGNSAFNGCAGFTGSLTIPASVTTIDIAAFSGCTGFDGALTILPAAPTIGENAFYNCTNLTGITSGITDFTNIDSTAFNTIKNKPVTCDPAYVQIHQSYGFTNVVGAAGAAFTIGALTYTVLTAPVDSTPGTVSVKATDRSTISGSLTLVGSVTDSGKTYTVTTIEASAFYGCTGLTGNLSIPSSVTTIGASAFYGCTGLTGSLTLPAGVTTIGNSAFNGCAGFTGSLTIPASVTTISSSAFNDCTGFNGTLTILPAAPAIGGYAFNNCTNLTGITSGITDFANIDVNAFNSIKDKPVTCDPAYVQIHQSYGFTNVVGAAGAAFTIGALTYTVLTAPVDSTPGTVSVKATDISTISGPLTLAGSVENGGVTYTVTTISDAAFSGCTALTSLTLNTGLVTIGASAFNGCTGLTGNLTIPSGVTTIGTQAFDGCVSLSSVEFPSELTGINALAFGSCSGLASVCFWGDTPPAIFDTAFQTAAPGLRVIVPEGKTSVYTTTFTNSTPLDKLPAGAYIVEYGVTSALTVTNLTVNNKTYDGTNTVTLSGTPALSGIDSNYPNVQLSGTASATFSNVNAGIDKPVTITGLSLTGTDAALYHLDLTGFTGTITPKALTASMITIPGTSTYTGTAQTPAITVTDGTLGTLTEGTDYDTITAASYSNNTNVGTASVSVSGKGNYSGTVSQNFTIGKAQVTVAQGTYAVTKVYDGTTSAGTDSGALTVTGAVTTNGGVDVVASPGAYPSANVGASHSVTITLSLSGMDMANHELQSNTLIITDAEITAAAYSGTPTLNQNVRTGAERSYSIDLVGLHPSVTGTLGTVTYQLGAVTDTAGIIKSAPAIAINSGMLEFTSNNVAVTTTGTATVNITLQTQNYGNISATVTLTLVDKNDVSANINFAASNLTYNGAEQTVAHNASVSVSGGTWTYTYAATGSGASLGGTNKPLTAGDYTVTAQYEDADNIGSKIVSFTMNQKGVTITGLSAQNKAYDGNSDATPIGTAVVNGKLGTDDVTVTVGTAAFANANVGNNKTVTFTGYGLGGNDANNYTLTAQPASVTANITAKELTITGATHSKTYDRTTAASGITGWTFDNLVTGDSVTVSSYTAAYTSAAAGTTTINVTAMTLGSNNYTVTLPANVTVAGITAKDFSASDITIDAIPAYNYTGSQITPTPIVKYGSVTLTATTDYTVTYGANEDAGTNAGSVTVTGTGNYTGSKTANFTINKINQTTLTIDDPGAKTYGSGTFTLSTNGGSGTGTVTYNITSGNDVISISGDTVTILKAGTATVTATKAGDTNYNSVTSAARTITINKAPLTITGASIDAKTYDGTTTATVTGVTFSSNPDGLALGTDFTASGTFDSAAAGTGKTVTVTVTLKNTSKANNYTISGTYNLTGQSIGKATLPTISTQTVKNYFAEASTGNTVDLAALLPATERATATYSVTSINTLITGASVNASGVLTFNTSVATSGANEDITIDVTMANYDPATITVTVNFVDKKVPVVTPTVSGSISYGQPLSALTISATAMVDGTTQVTGSIAWDNPSSKPAVGAGAQGWTFTPTNTTLYEIVTGSSAITVNKATPSGTPTITSITQAGKTLADANLTPPAGGFVNPNDGTMTVPGTLAWNDGDGTTVTANAAYGWTFTPTDAANYNNRTGSFTPYAVIAQHTISYNANGGSGTMASDTVNDGNSYTIKANAFSRTNNTFTGWNTQANGGGTAYAAGAIIPSVTANITLYAQWNYTGGNGGGGGGSGSGGGGGGSSGGSTTTTTTTTPPTTWLEQNPAGTLVNSAKGQNQDYVRTRSTGACGVRKAAFAALAGLKYEHDTVADGAVQVRLYINDPANIKNDLMVSGYVKGSDVDYARNTFEKWFNNKVRAIHMDQTAPWGQPVQIAARIDLTGMDSKKLYFYSYDKKTNTYKRIEKPAYWIDKNGYLHFETELAGDIIISEGPLERK